MGVGSVMPLVWYCDYMVKQEVDEVEPDIRGIHGCVDMVAAIVR